MARPRGPRPPREEIERLMATGASWTEIGAALGFPEYTVRRAARDAGLVLPQPARQVDQEPASAPNPPAPLPPAAAVPVAAPAAHSERARQLIQDPRLVLEELAELATDRGVPASQRFRAQKTLSDALLGKAKAGQPVGPGGQKDGGAGVDFDPRLITDLEDRRRWMEARQEQLRIEAKYLGEGGDAPEA